MQTNQEIRSYLGTIPTIEERADGKESRNVTGYAAVFDKLSHPIRIIKDGQIILFKEKVSRSFFDDVLDDDVVALFNHDPNFIQARNKISLKLSVDDIGLRYDFSAPNTTAGNDLLENIKNKNVLGSSFRFEIADQKWELAPNTDSDGVREYRTLIKCKKIYDVGPVVYPAYPDTTAAKRSRDEFYQESGSLVNQEWEGQARQRQIELLKLT